MTTGDMVLELLRRGPLTGRDLVARSSGRLERATLYVRLAAIEAEGLVVSSPRVDGGRLYELAAAPPQT